MENNNPDIYDCTVKVVENFTVTVCCGKTEMFEKTKNDNITLKTTDNFGECDLLEIHVRMYALCNSNETYCTSS